MIGTDHDNWEKHWEDFNCSASFNPAQAYRRKLIIQALKKYYQKDCKILDIGSGQGDLVAELQNHFPPGHLFGIELSEKGVSLSKNKVKNAHFYQANLLNKEELPLSLNSQMDLGICSEVLEHLDDPLLFLNHTTFLLKKGAKLIVTVPSGPLSAYDRYLGHRKHFKKKDLKILLEAAGFRTLTIFSAGFPFFNFYKLIVILRGKKLIQDNQKNPSMLAKFIMKSFTFLFLFNFLRTGFGWQLIAVAEY